VGTPLEAVAKELLVAIRRLTIAIEQLRTPNQGRPPNYQPHPGQCGCPQCRPKPH
jgi:hypothetical protein